MATKPRYFSDDDDVGKTPAGLKRLSRARQKEYLLYWFQRNFEDPVEETPYESAEGGYQYIWGGPYDANEELDAEFGGVVPYEVINSVAAEVESDGVIEWAPGPEHPKTKQRAADWESEAAERDEPEPDLDDIIKNLEVNPVGTFGDGYERQLRQNALDALTRLYDALKAPRPEHGGIGHNNPPPDVEPATAEAMAEIQTAVDLLVEEIEKPEPNVLEVAKATKRLRLLGGWAATKADRFADSFATTLGVVAATAAGAAAVHLGPEMTHLIAAAATHLCHWLSHVASPF